VTCERGMLYVEVSTPNFRLYEKQTAYTRDSGCMRGTIVRHSTSIRSANGTQAIAAN
jgi:hypothetical protein